MHLFEARNAEICYCNFMQCHAELCYAGLCMQQQAIGLRESTYLVPVADPGCSILGGRFIRPCGLYICNSPPPSGSATA